MFDIVKPYAKLIFDFDSSPGRVYLLTTVLLLLAAYYVYPRKRYRLPPGPRGLPLIGYWKLMASSEPYKILDRLAKKYGNVFSVSLGQDLCVILNDWPALKEGFGMRATANRKPGIFEILPNGLGFASDNGIEWFEQRRFSVKAMRDIGLGRPKWEQLLQEEVKETVIRIKQLEGKPVSVSPLLAATFISNIMSILLGERMRYGHPEVEFAGQSVDRLVHNLPALGLANFMPRLAVILTWIGLYGQRGLKAQMRKFTEFLKIKMEEKLETKTQNDAGDDDSFVKKYHREWQALKKGDSPHTFSDRYFYGNTQVLVVGGGETTRTGFTWLVIAMAENPQHQEKVQREIDDVLGKQGHATWAQRTQLPYTMACILEALRWRSVVPVNTLRMTSEDIKLQGYDIPKNTCIVANFWGMHNDTRYWNRPDLYKPERFLGPDREILFKRESYAPFSYGKRMCPGELIAMMEILMYFTAIMQAFRIEPDDGRKVKYGNKLGLSHQPTDLKLRFVLRN